MLLTKWRDRANSLAHTAAVLIALCLVSSGCRSLHNPVGDRLVNPAACPNCKARTIDACQCFPAAENAGYCETNWSCLEIVPVHGAYLPEFQGPVEEVPPPQILLDSERQETGLEVRANQAASHRDYPVVRRIAHWETETGRLQSKPATRDASFTEIEDEHSDYFREW
jgi:hypothetical protein